MNYILFDDNERDHLLPLVFTRPVADIRIGILTIREKWEKFLNSSTSTLTEDYLSVKYPLVEAEDNVMINGSYLPSQKLVDAIHALKAGEALLDAGRIVARRCERTRIREELEEASWDVKSMDEEPFRVKYTWDIFSKNARAIKDDFELLTNGRNSEHLSGTNRVLGDPSIVFLEKGAKVEYTYLNTDEGPIYIGKDATVMEGAKIRGPFALCDHALVKMDAKIYSQCTIGPHSKVGGEIQNSVIFGYSNKGHDGYLGNAVIGEWCNLGADTNNSNLKNTYDIVKLWSYAKKRFVSTGLQFCGLIMGDHSKSGINTMFNTGTVVGVSSNLYGAGFQRNFVPSFSWGSPAGLKEYNMRKAIEVATAVMKRRGLEFDEVEQNIFRSVLELSIGERR